MILLPHKGIWIPNIHSRIAFFIWTCYLAKILTVDHLQRRGQNLANRCILCMEEEESINQIFIHCLMGRGMWYFFLSHFQIPWVFPMFFNELILGWWLSGLRSFHQDIWCALPRAICQGLWKERNNRIFENNHQSQSKLEVFIYNTLFEWASVWEYFNEKEWYAIWREEF